MLACHMCPDLGSVRARLVAGSSTDPVVHMVSPKDFLDFRHWHLISKGRLYYSIQSIPLKYMSACSFLTWPLKTLPLVQAFLHKDAGHLNFPLAVR